MSYFAPMLSSLRPLLLCAALTLSMVMRGQYNEQAIRNYIDQWWSVAVEEMQEHGIPASISLAQGILESAAGTSELAHKSNNHFGIKCHKEWAGETVSHDDDAAGECFRKYGDPEDSWTDHSQFLLTRERYAALFELKADDYDGWAHGLKKAGYATNPKYAELLIKLIDNYSLHQYDRYDQQQLADAEGHRNKPTAPETPGPAVSSDVFWFNRIPTVLARQGDYPVDISERQDVPLPWLCHYNDFEPSYALTGGEKVYLKPKRRLGSEKEHVVEPGETLRDIAQEYGVLLALLARRNQVSAQVAANFVPAAGERIALRGKAPHPPKAAASKPTVKPALTKPQPDGQMVSSDRTAGPGTSTPRGEFLATDQQPALAQTTSRPAQLAIPGAEFHQVATGETLYGISRRYNVSVESLRSWNNLPDNTIKVGQQLVVGD